MIGTLLSFTTMAVAIRELSPNHGAFSIVAMRSIVALAVLVPAAAALGAARLRSRAPAWQLARNLVHFLGTSGWTYGLGALPLATVVTLEFTMPAWAALLAIGFLGERMTRARGIAIAGGIIGVLVILRPGAAPFDGAVLIVLGAAAAYAGAHTMTKHLTRRDDIVAILFWMSLIQLPIALVMAAVFEDPRLPDAGETPWMLLIGLSAVGAHFCLTRALAAADAIVVVPLDFLRLPLIAVVAALMYGESLEIWVAAGAAIIVASLFYALRHER